ncbi:hypothetical protein RFM23_13095 [Mesorhizobium abyssinicae]|uniref:Uncharacterized protein n=1 Tax=Mesorhizobium abyssinicae TaxID=1209958 RepID=A0ABU5AMQ5_9HYPH|nr:hypothetical protein [Mesorhizobium abyssinicae]MDX8538556.1 hypothetical protein [Mesorhizobium abyssinicae]
MKWFAPFSIALHIATIFFLWAALKNYSFVTPGLYEAAKKQDALDALNVAVQIGRLDYVTLLLTVFGILVGIAAVIGFSEIRVRAQEVAKEAAMAEAQAFLNERAPQLVSAYMSLLAPNYASKTTGDDVAAAYSQPEVKK